MLFSLIVGAAIAMPAMFEEILHFGNIQMSYLEPVGRSRV
jgi:hypothetical protein